jgi:hypothetical protein
MWTRRSEKPTSSAPIGNPTAPRGRYSPVWEPLVYYVLVFNVVISSSDYIYIYIQGDSNMTGTDLCVNKPHSVPVIFEPPCIYIYIQRMLGVFANNELERMWEGRGRELIWDTIPEFAWRDWGKPRKSCNNSRSPDRYLNPPANTKEKSNQLSRSVRYWERLAVHTRSTLLPKPSLFSEQNRRVGTNQNIAVTTESQQPTLAVSSKLHPLYF